MMPSVYVHHSSAFSSEKLPHDKCGKHHHHENHRHGSVSLIFKLPEICAHTGRLTSAMPGLIELKKSIPALPLSTIFALHERRQRKEVSRRITEIFGKQVCLNSAVYLYIGWPP